jgi:hypothetical protein
VVSFSVTRSAPLVPIRTLTETLISAFRLLERNLSSFAFTFDLIITPYHGDSPDSYSLPCRNQDTPTKSTSAWPAFVSNTIRCAFGGDEGESNPCPEHFSVTFNEFYIYIVSQIMIVVNVFLQVCQILFFSLNEQLSTFILYCNGNYDLIDWSTCSFFKHFCIG